MRDDNRYEYNMDVSRTLAQRGAGTMTHMGSSLAQYPQEMPLLGSGGMPTSYRGSGYPNVNTKSYYYSMGTELADAYGADGSVDYGLGCPPYQVISSDPVQMPVASSYGNWPTARPKSTTQGGAAGGGGLYLDSDSGYGSYGPASNTNLVHRPAVSVAGDSSPYSFSGFAASLPSAGASSNERLLPTPVSRAVVAGGSSANSTAYRADGLSANAAPSCYGASKSGHQSPSGVVVGVGSTGIQGSPTSPISEVTGYASSAYDYATTTTNGARSSQQQHHHHHGGSSAADVYASAGGAETIFGDADRSAGTQGSAVDLSGYTYGAPSPADSSSLRRASSGSGLTSRSTAESSTSSVSFGGGSDGGPPPPSSLSLGQGTTTGGGPYQHHSSSASSHAGQLHHGHHHHHHHHHHQHHSSPRHGGQHHHHHISEQQQQQQHQRGVVVGSTAYGAGSTSSNGIPGGGNTTAAADSSHRPSVATRR